MRGLSPSDPLYPHIASLARFDPVAFPTCLTIDGCSPNSSVTTVGSRSAPKILNSTVYSCIRFISHMHPSLRVRVWGASREELSRAPQARLCLTPSQHGSHPVKARGP